MKNVNDPLTDWANLPGSFKNREREEVFLQARREDAMIYQAGNADNERHFGRLPSISVRLGGVGLSQQALEGKYSEEIVSHPEGGARR